MQIYVYEWHNYQAHSWFAYCCLALWCDSRFRRNIWIRVHKSGISSLNNCLYIVIKCYWECGSGVGDHLWVSRRHAFWISEGSGGLVLWWHVSFETLVRWDNKYYTYFCHTIIFIMGQYNFRKTTKQDPEQNDWKVCKSEEGSG